MDQGFMIKLRAEPSVLRVDKPSKPAKARMLGYKAKTGFVIVRVKIGKGTRKKRAVHMGRKPSKSGMLHFSTKKSLQGISEERATRKFPNLEVLNSYYVAQDGENKWFEVVMTKLKDKGRALRGLTKQGKKARGMLHKGKTTA